MGACEILPLLLVFPWLALWAVYDILIVARMFNPMKIWGHPLHPYPYGGSLYHWATWGILFPLTTLAAFGLTMETIAVAILFLGGWEDTLYFWLQGQQPPKDLPLLTVTPTRKLLFFANGASLLTTAWIVWVVMTFLPSAG